MSAAEMADRGMTLDEIAEYRIDRPEHAHGWHDLEWIALTDRPDAIRIYARLGLHPIAIHGLEADGACTCRRTDCGAVGKHPVLKAWQRAPLDLDELDAMLSSNWRLNIGLRMGVQPDGMTLVCIDVDGPRSLLEPLEAEHGPLPETLTARTGSGGLHLIYRVPVDRAPSNRVRLSPGVDVRSEGGQIVCAPSRHRSGRTYQWLTFMEPAWLFGGPSR